MTITELTSMIIAGLACMASTYFLLDRNSIVRRLNKHSDDLTALKMESIENKNMRDKLSKLESSMESLSKTVISHESQFLLAMERFNSQMTILETTLRHFGDTLQDLKNTVKNQTR